MTTPVGGLRDRLIRDSLRLAVEDILRRRHWFETVPSRLPVTLLPKPADWDEPINLNSVAITIGTIPDPEPAEVGSNYSKRVMTFYVDFFAENESIGMELTGDLRDGLGGRMPSVGRPRPTFDVYDLTQATPPVLFTMQITRLQTDQPPADPGKAWTSHLYVLTIEAEDYYGDETDA